MSENGGDLGFIRRSDVVREFANVAFNLSPGAISAPVKTQYGYHLIKVERVRGAEVQARHILLRPEISESDAVRARARADSVATRARAGEDMATTPIPSDAARTAAAARRATDMVTNLCSWGP